MTRLPWGECSSRIPFALQYQGRIHIRLIKVRLIIFGSCSIMIIVIMIIINSKSVFLVDEGKLTINMNIYFVCMEENNWQISVYYMRPRVSSFAPLASSDSHESTLIRIIIATTKDLLYY